MRQPTVNKYGLKKISPSKILNYYYPMQNNIDKDILILAGARGNVIHESIEEYLLNGVNKLDEKIEKINVEINKYGLVFSEKDIITIKKQFKYFLNYHKELLEIDKNSMCLEFHSNELTKIHGFIDYHDDLQIIDWKTNSVLGKKEIEKYTLQQNLYRYFLYYEKFIDIKSLKIIHLTKQDELTPNFKERKPEQLFKIIECDLIDFEELEKMIDEVYEFENKK